MKNVIVFHKYLCKGTKKSYQITGSMQFDVLTGSFLPSGQTKFIESGNRRITGIELSRLDCVVSIWIPKI